MKSTTVKHVTSFCSAIFLVLLAADAGAVSSYLDIDGFGGVKLSSGSSLTGTFDIMRGDGDVFRVGAPYFDNPTQLSDAWGFVPGEETIYSAELWLGVRDDGDLYRGEIVKIALSDLSSAAGVVEWEGNTFDVDARVQALLETGGTIEYEIHSTYGDFHVDYAALRVSAGGGSTSVRPATPVPEPSAALLSCVALLFVSRAAARRTRSATS